MDKIIILVLLSTLTLHISLVSGSNGGNLFRTNFGSRQWNPMNNWRRRPHPLLDDFQRNVIYESTDTGYDDDILRFAETSQNNEQFLLKRTSTDGNPIRAYVGGSRWNPENKLRQRVHPLPIGFKHNVIYESTDTGVDDDILKSSETSLENNERFISKRSPPSNSLCDVVSTLRILGNDTDGYDYRPKAFSTVTCLNSHETGDPSTCSMMGYNCIQVRGSVFVTRRKNPSKNSKTTGCWEHIELEDIDFSCECGH
ncbi:uncharacterized protein LOC129770487 isoform X1 [Toxorhynchites rutilus septentrionalis]|uniref:uncharacterized protein LOC129770487 isoform X1 n=1 Tax=Toxorhynchites rutilus septentrionalis TaxID=329112 RepID=UPI00247A3D1C|nr:uncharacterized protein LOC129770487 isoform X1 [Toxorhynchites rutilus septentrionalis]